MRLLIGLYTANIKKAAIYGLVIIICFGTVLILNLINIWLPEDYSIFVCFIASLLLLILACIIFRVVKKKDSQIMVNEAELDIQKKRDKYYVLKNAFDIIVVYLFLVFLFLAFIAYKCIEWGII